VIDALADVLHRPFTGLLRMNCAPPQPLDLCTGAVGKSHRDPGVRRTA
jgi:hypothetical protein